MKKSFRIGLLEFIFLLCMPYIFVCAEEALSPPVMCECEGDTCLCSWTEDIEKLDNCTCEGRTCMCIEEDSIKEISTTVIKDDNFKKCLKDMLEKKNTVDGQAYSYSLANITKISTLSCPNYGIKDISGLSTLNKLTELNLANNKITNSDIAIFNKNLADDEMVFMLDSSYFPKLTKVDFSGTGIRVFSIDSTLASKITHFTINSNDMPTVSINNLISDLTNLVSFSFNDNKYSGTLDVSKLSKLTYLYAHENSGITSVKLPDNNFNVIDLGKTGISSLDVSKMTNLAKLYLNSTNISNIDLSKNVNLTLLNLNTTKVSSVNVSNMPKLVSLYANNNRNITSIDVSNNPELTILDVKADSISKLDLSKNTKLEKVTANNNKLQSISLPDDSGATSDDTNLQYLTLSNNSLTSIDLTKSPRLKELWISSNQLSTIDLSKNTKLEQMDFSLNNSLTDVNLNNNLELQYLGITSSLASKIDFSKLSKLKELNYRDFKVIPVYGTSFSVNNALKYVPSYLTVSDYEFKEDFDSPKAISTSTVSGDAGDYYKLVLEAKKASNSQVTGFSGTQGFSGYYGIYFVKLSSDKYVIDESNSKIDVGGDSDEEIIKNLKATPSFMKISVSGNQLSLSYLGEEFKTFTLQRVTNPKTGLNFVFFVGFMLLVSLVVVIVVRNKMKEQNHV